MSIVGGIVVFEVALTSGLFLLGWTYQSTKTDEQKHIDYLRDTEDPRLAEYVAKVGAPLTMWDLALEKVKRFNATY